MEVRKLFQYVLMGIGAFIFVLAIGLFASYKPSQKAVDAGIKANLKLWGAMPIEIVQPMISLVGETYQDLKIQYTEIPGDQMANQLTTAMATGTGPDMILIDDQHVLQYYPLVQSLDFAQYPESAYRSTYADAGSVFVLPWTIVGFPVAIDPLVLYYNRDLLTAGYESEPAHTWLEILDHVKKFTQVDSSGRISFATIPIGTISNVRHGVDILSMLASQQLNPLVTYSLEKFTPTLQGIPNSDQSQDTSIARPVEFMSAFVNPNSSSYTWNAGFSDSLTAFLGEQSLYYFGFGSEYNTIRTQNPNLNLGITIAPQIDTKIQIKKSTAGRVYALSITKTSNQKLAAYNAIQIIAGNTAGSAISGTGLVPARLDLLGVTQSDPRIQTLYKSALITRSWWNPNALGVENVFDKTLQSFQSGTMNTYDALDRMSQYLERELGKIRVPSSDDLPTGAEATGLPGGL